MSISSSQLRAFHAVALCGSFSKAADSLHLSQPAISDQIRKLEERYGILLFYRNKRRVQLTDLGKQLLDQTHHMFVAEATIEELLINERALKTGQMTIAVDSTIHLLPHLVAFHKLYPGIQVRVATGNTEETLERLFDYNADIAIVGKKLDDPRIVSIDLSHTGLVAFTAIDKFKQLKNPLRWADLKDYPLIMREKGSVTRELIENEFRRCKQKINIIFEVEGREAIKEIVATGTGIGIVSAAEFSNDPRLRAIPIIDCEVKMSESVVCLTEQTKRKIISAFLAVVSASNIKKIPA